MAIILAIALCLGGVASLAAYNGTDHVSGAPGCGPIDVLGVTFNVDFDCITTSHVELILAIVCFSLAVLAVIFGRGGSEHSRW